LKIKPDQPNGKRLLKLIQYYSKEEKVTGLRTK
jgi:hypothetical protein